mmetsp:Transcript_11975/g.23124  ORF Transcript_11975/g.23124 Transcript_11975/m.23124 type:complete len:257 (+) Transcript_11975:468-1238(+)
MACGVHRDRRAAVRLRRHPPRLRLPRLPLSLQPRSSHAGHSVSVCLHGHVRRLHRGALLQNVQGHSVACERALDCDAVPWHMLLSLLRGEPPHLGAEVVWRCPLHHPPRYAPHVALHLRPPRVGGRVFRLPHATDRAARPRQPDPPPGSERVCAHGERTAEHPCRGHPAVWGGVCGGLLRALLHMAPPDLLPLRHPLPRAGHPAADVLGGVDCHVLLPTLRRGLPLVVALLLRARLLCSLPLRVRRPLLRHPRARR